MSESDRLAREALFGGGWYTGEAAIFADKEWDAAFIAYHSPTWALANAEHIARLEADLTRAQDSLREIHDLTEHGGSLLRIIHEVARRGLGEGE